MCETPVTVPLSCALILTFAVMGEGFNRSESAESGIKVTSLLVFQRLVPHCRAYFGFLICGL